MLTAREQFFANSDQVMSTPTTGSLGWAIEVINKDNSTPRQQQQQQTVYNATTVPLSSASDWRSNSNGQQTNGNGSFKPSTTQSNKNGMLTSPSTTTTIVNTTTADTLTVGSMTPQLQQQQSDVDYSDHEQKFTHLPFREPVDMEFKELSLTVNLGFRKGSKEILHSVHGKFMGSQLIAIMGPSGAGKSTLLDALSGFKTTGVDGSILINGRRRDLTLFRRMSCYITQDDRLHPLLTVKENMHIAADLKLGPSVSYEDKEEIIEDILQLLGLIEHDRTLTKRLSGGQKKRLSIAMELVNNPTVMFLDEPTTGLDSSSCTKVLELCKKLAQQGRTIICTIHQPTAKLFQIFDHVYVLATGNCVYQGSTSKLVPYLDNVNLPCPVYHNPADYIIELACGEYGVDKVTMLTKAAMNGSSWDWFDNPSAVMRSEALMRKHRIPKRSKNRSLEDTTFSNQLSVLMKRGYIKAKRDTTMTYLRVAVNIFVGIILGSVYVNSGIEGSRVIDNYNLLFAILIHHVMSNMMLTVLTFPMEMNILLKEHFNRWYSLKAYYTSVTLLDLPILVLGSGLFSVIIYYWSYQPMEWDRFWMFFAITLLIVTVGQSMGLVIGAWFDVVNGTFLAPVTTIPMMMFSGYGIAMRDMPYFLKWGAHISYLRYGIEGYVGAIYGNNRNRLECNEAPYCHYRYPEKFLQEIDMRGDQFWNDVIALGIILLLLRIAAYVVLKAKIQAVK